MPDSAHPRLPRNRQRWNLDKTRIPVANSADEYSLLSMDQSQEGLLEEGQDEEGLVPLSVVMDACLVQGIKQQYTCVSKACMGYAFIPPQPYLEQFIMYESTACLM